VQKKDSMFQKVSSYIKDASDELLHKVSWPTWSELQNSAIIVLVASLMIALVVFAMDKTLSTVVTYFYETVA
jgi:preprotein translocase subunit SecE